MLWQPMAVLVLLVKDSLEAMALLAQYGMAQVAVVLVAPEQIMDQILVVQGVLGHQHTLHGEQLQAQVKMLVEHITTPVAVAEQTKADQVPAQEAMAEAETELAAPAVKEVNQGRQILEAVPADLILLHHPQHLMVDLVL